MNNYTINMEDKLWNIYEEEEECKALIEGLNNSSFRTFGEALIDIIKNKKGDNTLSEMDYLIASAKEKILILQIGVQ